MTATETEERKKEIRARAKNVYDISFNYHLIHAVFGSDGLLIRDRMEANKEELVNLNKALVVAKREKDTVLEAELMAEAEKLKKKLKRKYHILIDYVTLSDLEGGRVIKIDDKLIIELPKKLTSNIKDHDTGELQKEAVAAVREIMAHELGHIVLHTEEVPQGDLQGGAKLKHLDWEAEVFAKELLRLYSKKGLL